MATFDEFQRIDMRVGTITEAAPFPAARKPAITLAIDFGAEIGIRRSSAQITLHYAADHLVGRQVVAVVNFPSRRIAGFVSEVLVLGAMPEPHDVVLLAPDASVPNGTRIG
ncbi:MAG: tRNA-binding protein [Gemmatimonadota bacterium]|nr:tRNA-binding protein [Gemmatimonadota bacterium]